jgi:hypothetical protein
LLHFPCQTRRPGVPVTPPKGTKRCGAVANFRDNDRQHSRGSGWNSRRQPSRLLDQRSTCIGPKANARAAPAVVGLCHVGNPGQRRVNARAMPWRGNPWKGPRRSASTTMGYGCVKDSHSGHLLWARGHRSPATGTLLDIGIITLWIVTIVPDRW